MVTLAQVAEKAGVSASAVSLALFRRSIDSRTGHRRVSVATEKRIRALAEELHYRPNIMARGMRKQQTFIIGLVVNSISTSFYSQIIEGLTDMIESCGYHLLICHSNRSHEREWRHLSELQRKQVDGLIISPVLSGGNSRLAEGIENFQGRPVLLLGYNPVKHPFALIFDDASACADAVHYLHQLGHDRIGFVPASLERPHSVAEVSKWLPVRERLRAYKVAMKRAGLKPLVALRCGQFLTAVRNRSLTAVVASTDEVAASLYPLLKKSGFEIPQDLSVISLGDTAVAPLLDPPLTTICLPKVELGAWAGKMMIHGIEKKKFSLETMTMSLRERESCLPPLRKKSSPQNHPSQTQKTST